MRKYLFILLGLACSTMFSQTNPNGMLLRSTIGSACPSKSQFENNYLIQQSFGQSSVIGTNYKGGMVLCQGYIQPNTKRISAKNAPILALKTIVYPNPFTDIITISFEDQIYSNILVEVYDVSGKFIFTETYSPNQIIKVSLAHIPFSVYALVIVANQKLILQKIIKN